MYKIKFYQNELNRFNIIENEDIRKSCMSIYMYMLKLVNMEKEKFYKAELEVPKTNTLKISYRKFLKKYTRYHGSMSLPTFKSRVELLLEVGLIKINKVKNSFEYSFYRFWDNEKSNEKSNDSSVDETTDNADETTDSENPKDPNAKPNLDIDTRNNSDELHEDKNNNSFSNKFNSEGLERCSSWDDIETHLKNAFKEMKIKSSKLKNIIINKLEDNLKNITKKFASNYIRKAVLQVKVAEERRRTAYRRAIIIKYNSRKCDSWNNYGCEHGADYYINAAAKLINKSKF
ncbi:hypothetical protein [Clostridium tetani]|uniref:Uncharacterized protein n=1 Tax=Clostridium tetani TaxID=1513 RepID=A0ABC8EGL4_CLOTA|nr:hypothetical protein [Clostridium tetani]BDR82585.1 hypothetical protein K234311028_p20680 [Clostridium tetani]